MQDGAEIYQWIAGGLGTVLVLLVSFVFSRFSKLEEKLGLIADRTTRTEVELEVVGTQLERMNSTLDRIDSRTLIRSDGRLHS